MRSSTAPCLRLSDLLVFRKLFLSPQSDAFVVLTAFCAKLYYRLYGFNSLSIIFLGTFEHKELDERVAIVQVEILCNTALIRVSNVSDWQFTCARGQACACTCVGFGCMVVSALGEIQIC